MMSMLMGVLVLVVARGERKSLALRLWGWGLIAYAVGMLVIISSFFFPYDVTQVAGNSLTSRGVFMHVPERPGLRLVGAGLTAVVLILTLNHVLHGHLIVTSPRPPST